MATDELWRADEIANYLHMSKKSVQNRVVNSPSFPPARLLDLGNAKPVRRWVAREVMKWATRITNLA